MSQLIITDVFCTNCIEAGYAWLVENPTFLSFTVPTVVGNAAVQSLGTPPGGVRGGK